MGLWPDMRQFRVSCGFVGCVAALHDMRNVRQIVMADGVWRQKCATFVLEKWLLATVMCHFVMEKRLFANKGAALWACQQKAVATCLCVWVRLYGATEPRALSHALGECWQFAGVWPHVCLLVFVQGLT